MSNQEVMVVLSDGGKPVTVIRALDDSDDVISRRHRSPSATAGVRVPADVKRNSANWSDKDDRSKGKDFEDQTELRRLRAENSLLLQRIANLEKQHHQQQATGDCEASDERCRSSDAAAMEVEHGSADELQRLYDELVASKLREAEAHLSMKEFEQKLLQLQRNWQCFVDGSQSESSTAKLSAPSQAELRDTVMALRLREASLVSDMNALKRRLVELETQNHVNERKIKRQEVEQANLSEALSVAELNAKELQNRIVELQRKLSSVESKCKEDEVMWRIREAEHSQLVEQMRRRVAELEIENQELVTADRLQNQDGDVPDSIEQRISFLHDEETCVYDAADGVPLTPPGDVIDDVTLDQSAEMPASLLLMQTNDVIVTSSSPSDDADVSSPPIS